MQNKSELIADFLKPFLQSKINMMRQKLRDGGVKDGSALGQSLEPTVKIYPTTVEGSIKIDLAEDGTPYYEFIDRGVTGTKGIVAQDSPFKFKNEYVSAKMEKSLATWIKAKYGEGKGWDSKRGDFYGMGVNIKRRGIAPTHFITDVLGDNILGEVSDEMLDNFGIKVFDAIKRI